MSCAINDIISGLDSKNEDGAFGQDAPSHEAADVIVDEDLVVYQHSSEE